LFAAVYCDNFIFTSNGKVVKKSKFDVIKLLNFAFTKMSQRTVKVKKTNAVERKTVTRKSAEGKNKQQLILLLS